MRLIIERGVMARALGHVTGVVERRTTIPVLSNVLLSADGGALELRATDNDVEVTETVPAEVAQAGAITVGALVLQDIVRKLPDGCQVEFARSGDESRLDVSAGSARFQLQVLPADEFPSLSTGAMNHHFTVGAGELKRLIERTRFAISNEETRYYLNGIYLHATGDNGSARLCAVATDGHRLARTDMDLPAGAEDAPGVIIPRKTVGELYKLLEDTTSQVDVSLSPNKIRFGIGSLVLTSKLVDGTFPDYQRVIPQDNDKIMKAPKSELASAVDRVSTVSSDKVRAVRLNVGDGQLTLTVNNPDSGNATEELPVGFDSEPIEIGFNARYLMEIMGQMDGEEITLQMDDPGSPTTIIDEKDPSSLYVLMPMRV